MLYPKMTAEQTLSALVHCARENCAKCPALNAAHGDEGCVKLLARGAISMIKDKDDEIGDLIDIVNAQTEYILELKAEYIKAVKDSVSREVIAKIFLTESNNNERRKEE